MRGRYLFWIVAFGILLRFINLSVGDALFDEVLYGFRAIGPLDYFESKEQPTPLEWLDARQGDVPLWARMSFHDHPPLIFLLQHFAFQIFGETNFGLRFFSAFFGVLSIVLVYGISSILYSRAVGYIAAAFFAFGVNGAYISRIGLQESTAIFFMLLASFLYLRSYKNDNYLIPAGVAAGFAFLTKYTTFVLVPIFFLHLVFTRREYFLNKKLWIAVFLSLLVFSPVIVYNAGLWKNFGHLDFQFSYILGQKPVHWPVAPGKEIGGVSERFSRVIPNLIDTHSWIFLFLFFLTFGGFVFSVWRRRIEAVSMHGFLVAAFLALFGLIVVVGPAWRFLSMFTPWMVIAVSVLLSFIFQEYFRQREKTFFVILVLVLLFEAFYTINSIVMPYPRGFRFWMYAPVRNETFPYGYNELASYLEDELSGKMPKNVFELDYSFLEKQQEKVLRDHFAQKHIPYSAVIIYDNNINKMGQLWVLDRLNIYHAWPVLSTEQYLEYIRAGGYQDIKKTGFERYYFIRPRGVLLTDPRAFTGAGEAFEKNLQRENVQPHVIYNMRGGEAFAVYKF
ncbi:MAG: hypothetical protein A3F26_02770 [Candidatus Ryanbacteria bacterium RIFCSPHIGHO2_12_FULL_47_12b]|nr:MAG: hypothetical protein A3F26_02770 [Candidatus Ryanbacteria bacterium RIFCSPHIGHO2_12_FULL_47_12b]